jgi:hypothetical protein
MRGGKRLIVLAALLGNLVLAAVLYAVFGNQSVAEVWYKVDANSLVGLQALVEKRLDPNPDDPTLYFDVVLPLIETPLWLAALVVTCVLDLVPLALFRLPGGSPPTGSPGAGASTVERS